MVAATLAAPTAHSEHITAATANLVQKETNAARTLDSRVQTAKAFFAVFTWWFWVVVKLTFAWSLVIGLLVAYGLRFSVVTLGPFTLGLYGVIILADFIIQTTSAYMNRRHVEKLSAECEKRGDAPLDISIAVVGYREDSEAWKKCLHSLQKQEAAPKAIIGVVDGQDGPDQSMAEDFVGAFPPGTVLIGDFDTLLSKLYTTTYWANIPAEFHSKTWKAKAARLIRSIANTRTADEFKAEAIAWKAVYAKLDEWNEKFKIDQYKAICFTQPHGHKRTAMFTAFSIAMHIYKTKDAVFTTDSDTLLDPAALRHMSYLLASNDDYGGVTGDVKIWNKNESWLALMCALRYWFAFNIERACQSYYKTVTCISGPIGLYRTKDMRVILGPWVLQTFLGRDCTFGDDRHLTNRLLGEGRRTGYTHLAFCESDSPAGFVRWVKQQTRWSKSFFREAFWFPAAFAKQSTWLSVETLKQTLYPFILVSTVLQFLYAPTTLLRPVFWLATMFGVAAIKSTYGFIVSGDPQLLLFTFYGLFYFFGLLPSKIFALLTINVTAWGTSARSTAERKLRESFGSRNQHVMHLLVWFWSLGAGFVLFARHHAGARPLLFTLPVILPVLAFSLWPYWDLVQHDILHYSNMLAVKLGIKAPAAEGKIRLEADANEKSVLVDTEKSPLKPSLMEVPVPMIAGPPSALIERPSRPASVSRSSSTSSIFSVVSAPAAQPKHAAITPELSSGLSSESSDSVPSQESQDTVPSLTNHPTQFLAAPPRPTRSFKRMVSAPAVLDGEDEEAVTPLRPSNLGTSSTENLAERAKVEFSIAPPAPGQVNYGPSSPVSPATSYRRSSAMHVDLEKGQLVEMPLQTDTMDESRRGSAGRFGMSRFRRMSSLWTVSSQSTLVDDGSTERRPSLLSRRTSNSLSRARPSLAGRDSVATLVDNPSPSPLRKKASQSHLRSQNGMSDMYSSSAAWSLKNPFAAYDASQPAHLSLRTQAEPDLEAGAPPSAAELYKAVAATKLEMRDKPKEGYQPLEQPLVRTNSLGV